LGFSKVKRRQKKGEIFLLFLQEKKDQRRTGKNSKKIKAKTMDNTMEGEKGTYSPKLRLLA